MAYSAIDVAKHIINYCYDQNKPISNLKLQKILYFAWIDYYNETGGIYLFHDDICAWKFGPVVPKVYDRFCHYVGMPIRFSFISNLGRYDANILETSVKKNIDRSVYELVSRTHRPGGAWHKTYNNGKGMKNKITFDSIIRLECIG